MNITKRRPFYLLLLTFFIALSTGCSTTPVMSRDRLVELYPNIEEGSAREENKKIMCPFMRMIERSGILDGQKTGPEGLTVKTSAAIEGAKRFGCSPLDCTMLTRTSAFIQPGKGVNLARLYDIPIFSHECGFTYEYGGTEVSDEVRQDSINRLAKRADKYGDLTFQDIRAVQLEICKEQGVDLSFAGATESKLLFSYLGGLKNGVVKLSDVELFLNATMPKTKTRSKVGFFSTMKLRYRKNGDDSEY